MNGPDKNAAAENGRLFLGVDGCRAGWIAAVMGTAGDGVPFVFELFPSFRELWARRGAAASMLIDIPIGLASRSGPVRRTDAFARSLLPGKGSSVFTPPCREAVYAPDIGSGRRLNLEILGKSFSVQAWNIVPKIREMDLFFAAHPGAAGVVLESHPEIAFAMLAGTPLRSKKRTPEGFAERLDLLRPRLPGMDAALAGALEGEGRFPRAALGRDDLLDAAVLALAAREGYGRLRALPGPRERDERGLPLCIWYHTFAAEPETDSNENT